jgi:hypothetical protein
MNLTSIISLTAATLLALHATAAITKQRSSIVATPLGEPAKFTATRSFQGTGKTQEEARADAENQASHALQNYRIFSIRFSSDGGRYFCTLRVEYNTN